MMLSFHWSLCRSPVEIVSSTALIWIVTLSNCKRMQHFLRDNHHVTLITWLSEQRLCWNLVTGVNTYLTTIEIRLRNLLLILIHVFSTKSTYINKRYYSDYRRLKNDKKKWIKSWLRNKRLKAMKLMLLMYFEFLISLYFWLTNLSCRREPLVNQAVERNICFPVTASLRKAPKSRRNCPKLDDSVRCWIEKAVDGRKCLESEGSVENRTMAFKISKFSCFHLFRVPSKLITHFHV